MCGQMCLSSFRSRCLQSNFCCQSPANDMAAVFLRVSDADVYETTKRKQVIVVLYRVFFFCASQFASTSSCLITVVPTAALVIWDASTAAE